MARRSWWTVHAIWSLALLLVLSACGTAATPPPGTATGSTAPAATAGARGTAAPVGSAAGGATKEVKLGAVLSLTGDNQIYGTPQRSAMQLAVDEINAAGTIPGVKLTIIFEDDGGTKDKGITAIEKLIKTDNVMGLLGPTLSNTALAADPVAQQAGVPVVAVSNTAGGIVEIGDYIFRDSLSEAQVIPSTIKGAKDKLGLKKVAIIYGIDNAFTKAGYDVFKQSADTNGLTITSTQTYSANDTDYSAQLTAIKSSNPDALIISALAEGANIAKQARELGIDPKVTLIGGNGLNSPAYIKNAGTASEGTIVGAAWNSANVTPENTKFIAAYKAKYNADPDQFAAQAYTGVYIYAAALKSAGANVDRKGLRDALAGVKGLATPLGSFSFQADRNAEHQPVVQLVTSGQFAILK